MRFVIKLLLSTAVIAACAQIGRRWPSLSGLIAAMPLTTLVVLLWMYDDHPGDFAQMTAFSRSVVFAVVPTALFFATAWWCFSRHWSLPITLLLSFAVWLAAAFVHQWVVRMIA